MGHPVRTSLALAGGLTLVGDLSAWPRVRRPVRPPALAACVGELPLERLRFSVGRDVVRWLRGEGTGRA